MHSNFETQDNIPFWARTLSGLAFPDVTPDPNAPLPDFCIIGAGKCGTTSLASYLSQHPNIFITPVKETQFFSTDRQYEKGLDWYRSFFAGADSTQIVGEASVTYTAYPLACDVPLRMAQANSAMKLIYIVREPVARVQSACLQHLKYVRNVLGRKVEPRNLDTYLEDITDPDAPDFSPLLYASDYVSQIEQYEYHFPPEQILILVYEDFCDAPLSTLRSICAFLEVVEDFDFDLSSRLNVTRDAEQQRHKTVVAEKWKGYPGVKRLKTLLPRPIRSGLLQMFMRMSEPKTLKLSDAKRRELHAHFAPSIARLEVRISRSLGERWKTS